jgi:hypothetical protein
MTRVREELNRQFDGRGPAFTIQRRQGGEEWVPVAVTSDNDRDGDAPYSDLANAKISAGNLSTRWGKASVDVRIVDRNGYLVWTKAAPAASGITG